MALRTASVLKLVIGVGVSTREAGPREERPAHRPCIRSGDGAIGWRPERQTEDSMDPIKRPTRYQEMTDPQARPRYTGIPTFFRAPHSESLADTDIGVIGVPYRRRRHQPHRRPPRAAGGARPVLAAAAAPSAWHRAVRHRPRPRPRRLLDRAALRPGRRAGRDRRVLHDDRRGEGRAAVGRRRSFDQPADPARGRGASGRSA